MTDLSRDEARRIALAAQGFAEPRPRGRVDIRHLRRVVSNVQLLQIDTVNVLVRAHYTPLFSRLGPYPTSLLDDAVYQRRELYETWAHVASLAPVAHHPLLRDRMDGPAAERWRRWAQQHARYVDAVLDEVRRRGPITAGELEDPGGRRGSTFWVRSEGRLALDWLFRTGAVMIAARPNFERSYDLTERVLPGPIRGRPTPDRDTAARELLLLAARAHGVGTAGDLADYYRLPLRRARDLLSGLVDEGQLRRVTVEGWKGHAYLHPEAHAPRAIDHRALLTPFDSLVWVRERTERLFDFRYRIEIYVPEKQRAFGYYVLPFLLGDRLVGRVDLKADRAKGVLLVRGAFVEDGEDARAVARELAAELRLMADWLGLEDVKAARRGNLAASLGKALASRRSG